NVIVPGGQQIYIAPDSSLSFTRPHSAYIPPGSVVTGFTLQDNELVSPSRFFTACADDDAWKVYVPLETSDIAISRRCIAAFRVATAPATNPVWEYV
ncbi:hypothetical protein E4U43_005640, partial [Claviceps pusilla]